MDIKELYRSAIQWETRWCAGGPRVLTEAVNEAMRPAAPPPDVERVIHEVLTEAGGGSLKPASAPAPKPTEDLHAKLAGAFLSESAGQRPVSDLKTPEPDAQQARSLEQVLAALKVTYGAKRDLPVYNPYTGTFKTLHEQQADWERANTAKSVADPHAGLAGTGPLVDRAHHERLRRSGGV